MSLLLLFEPPPLANALAIVNKANTTVYHLGSSVYSVEKTGGAAATYDSDAVSSVGMASDFVLRIKPVNYTGPWMAGVNTDPLTDSSYTSLDYAMQNNSGSWNLFESSVQVVVGIAEATYGWIWRVGTDLFYGVGATFAIAKVSPSRTVNSVSSTLYFDSSVSGSASKFEVLFYLPQDLVGSSSLTFAASATATGKGALSGSTSLTFAPSGTPTGPGALSGTSTLTFAASGTATGSGALSGTSPLSFTPSSAITGTGALSGTSALTLSPTATLTGLGALSGVSSVTFAPVGTLSGVVYITGVATLAFTVLGALTAIDIIADAKATRRLRNSNRDYIDTWGVWR